MRIIFILLQIISWALAAFEICMLARAIMSWFPSARSSKIYYFFYTITEPFLVPVRNFLMRFNWVRQCPLDLSFLALWLILSAVSSMVQRLAYIFI